MAKAAEDFWGVIKHFGPVAAAQLAAIVIPVIIFQDNRGAAGVSQIIGVLLVTVGANAAAYNAGKRDALDASTKDGG